MGFIISELKELVLNGKRLYSFISIFGVLAFLNKMKHIYYLLSFYNVIALINRLNMLIRTDKCVFVMTFFTFDTDNTRVNTKN